MPALQRTRAMFDMRVRLGGQLMIYPPLSDSVVMPEVNGIYIVASYATQSYEAYKKGEDKSELMGVLPFIACVGDNGNKMIDRWLQDVGYMSKEGE